MKQSLIVTLNMIPEDHLVGLITFGTVVQVYDLAYTECVKSYVFRGDKEITVGKVQELLSSFRVAGGQPKNQPDPLARLLMPRGQCEFQLSTILEDLQPDPWPVQPGHRPLRCTGAACSLASALLELGFTGSASRLMLFIGGAFTLGSEKLHNHNHNHNPNHKGHPNPNHNRNLFKVPVLSGLGRQYRRISKKESDLIRSCREGQRLITQRQTNSMIGFLRDL